MKHKNSFLLYSLGILTIVIVGLLIAYSTDNDAKGKGKRTDEKSMIETTSKESEGWALILVNRDHPLPDDFSVELTPLRNGQSFDTRAYPALQEMMDAMRTEGLDPLICSSYRTQEKQQRLYENQVQKYLNQGYTRAQAEAEAAKWSAIPGTSEHQTGLAADIVAVSYQTLDEAQEETAVQQWLLENCWDYGFILRYPPDKSEITGISYEPWHYRYVGHSAAREIREKGLCLEEYLEG